MIMALPDTLKAHRHENSHRRYASPNNNDEQHLCADICKGSVHHVSTRYYPGRVNQKNLI